MQLGHHSRSPKASPSLFTSAWLLAAPEGAKAIEIEINTAITVFVLPVSKPFSLADQLCPRSILSRIGGNKYMPGLLTPFILLLGRHSVVYLKVHP